MKRTLSLILAMAAIGVASMASAQDPNTPPTNLTLRFGGGFAIDQSLNQYSNSYWGLGIDYDLNRSFTRGGATFISVDYLWATRGSFHDAFLPVALNEKFYLNPESKFQTRRGYGILGLGGTYYITGGSDFKIGGRAGLGIDVGEKFCVEAVANLASRSKNQVTANIIGIYFGLRY